MTFRFIIIVISSLGAAGCAVQRTAPTETAAESVDTETIEDARTPTPAAPPFAATVAEEPSATPEPGPSVPAGTPTAVETARASDEAAPLPKKPVAAVPTAGASALPALGAATPAAPPAVAPQPPVETLDFTSLGTRLRTTKAIGVLTKLSVKNQADDLLEQFRGYHQQQGEATLPELRRSYDLLVLKLLSLVRDGDPPLAMDIDRSRAAIWNILADQRKFVDANLMAGASR